MFFACSSSAQSVPLRVLPLSLAFAMGAISTACFNPQGGSLETESSATQGGGTQPSAGSGDSGSQSGEDTRGGTESAGTSDDATTDGMGDSTSNGSDSDDPTSNTSGDTSGAGCMVGTCVAAVPNEWRGPFLLTADASCPETFPNDDGVAHRDLIEGNFQCNCSCSVGTVSCQLVLENSGNTFLPTSQCQSPPGEDECIGVQPSASCITSPSSIEPTPAWENSRRMCSGAVPLEVCDGGSCLPAEGPVCVARDGDHACPADFPQRSLRFGGFEDDRSCSPCNCAPSGAICEAVIEICGVGFDTVTLNSGSECQQLNSGDGGDVTLISISTLATGMCSATPSSGQVEGAVAQVEPITLCCVE